MDNRKHENKNLKINFAFGGYKKDQVVRVSHVDGAPAQKFWRDRINDSKNDGCVSYVNPEKKSFTPKTTIKKEEG